MLVPRREPIIVVGMHRSGTSLFSRCLRALGVFVGNTDEGHDEDVWFRGLNTWVTAQCHAGWEEPGPVRYLLQDARARAAAVDYLELSVTSPRVVGYLGYRRFLAARTPARLAEPWGWKDPVNTLTLPLWLEVFPQARVVHLRRHGVDVAQSLHTRHAVMLDRGLSVYEKRRPMYRFRPKGQGFGGVRTQHLEDCFTLWEEYLDAAETNTADLGDRLLSLSYEELLADPAATLDRVVAHADLPASGEQRQAAAGLVRGGGFGYRRTPELVAFAEARADRLARHGY